MSDVSMFRLHSEYDTAGDQEKAISRLMEQIEAGQERCVLMGVTGSGKTFLMANIIERLGLPTLILSHNKNLNRGHYLIDDRDKNGAKEFEGEHIHFGTEKFPDWQSVMKYLRSKEQL